MVTAFSDLRLRSIDREKYDNPATAIIGILLSGNTIGVQAIAKNLTVAACLERPSLLHLVNSEVLDTGQVIKTIGLLIDNLSNFFGVQTSQSLEEIAWIIFDKYSSFSLEDMILFFYKCKERTFATEYQHITARGINAEFLLIWFEKYSEQRIEERELLISKVRDENTSSFICPKSATSLKELSTKVHSKNQRRFQIKEIEQEFKQKEKSKQPLRRLANFYSDKILLFDEKNKDKSPKEICFLANQKAEKILEGWQTEFESVVENMTEEEKNLSELTLQRFKNQKLKMHLSQLEKEGIVPSAEKLFNDTFTKFIESHSIVCGGEFLRLIYSGKQFEPCSLKSAKNSLFFKLQEKVNFDYKNFEDQVVKKEEDFLNRVDYFRIWMWRWICLNGF